MASVGAVWLAAAAAAAQIPSPTGNLYGTALDPQGNAVGGATVTLNGPGAPQTTRSDTTGDFRFLHLAPGDYSLALERTGFEAARRDVHIGLGNAVLSITMPVAGVAEAVTVEGSPGNFDRREVQTGETFTRKELDSIPNTRDPWGIIQRVPGVFLETVIVGGEVTGHQNGFSGKGSPPEQNSYNLDGAAISLGGVSPIFFDFDSLDMIEVATGGSNLSLPSPGVTVNLVTRRGTNELRSSARALYTGGAGWDYGIEAGGPLWRDRVWLWGAFAHNDFLTHPFLNYSGEPLEFRDRLEHWNAKLNAQPVPTNTLTLSYTHFNRNFLGWQVGPDRDADSSVTNLHPGASYKVEDSQVLSANLFLSAYFAYLPTSSTDIPVGGLDEQADVDDHNVWRHSYQTRRVRDDKHQTGLNGSVFFDTGKLRHEVKLGLGYWHVRLDFIREWPGDELLGFVLPGEAQITRRQNAKSEVNLYDAFVGDTIQTGSLTVSVGGRFDYQQGRNFASSVLANPVFPELVPAVSYPGDTGYPVTWRSFQPRASVTYALGKGRTLLRGSYSRFTDQLDSVTVFATNLFPDITFLGYAWNDANGDGRVQPGEIDTSADPLYAIGIDPANPGSVVPVNQISRNLEPPTTDEFTVGVDEQIAPGFSGSLTYTHRVRRRMEIAPLVGTTRESWQFMGHATGIASDRGLTVSFDEPYYGLVDCPDPCAGGTILKNRPDTSELYDGVELQLVKSFRHGWTARASFAYVNERQRVGSAGIFNPNNEVPGTNANGPLLTPRWQFNVSATFPLPWGIAGGVNVFGREGFPTVYYVDVITNGPFFYFSPIQIGQATRYRLPNVLDADLQLEKTFRVGRVAIVPTFYCFNVLNRRTVLGQGGSVGLYDSQAAPAFQQYDGFATQYDKMAGRAYRGGVRIAF